MSSNPYKALGLQESATKEQIKKAYHKMSLKHHPDKIGGDENKFKVVAAAYEILSDPQKKMEYDEEHVEPMSAGKGGGSYPYEHSMFYERTTTTTTTTTYSNNPAKPCRFFDNCTRSDCYFYHPSGEMRTGLTSSPPKKAMAKGSGSAVKQPCRFLDNCYRSDCYFYHPSGEQRTGLTSSPPKKAMAKGGSSAAKGGSSSAKGYCSHTWFEIEEGVLEHCFKCEAFRDKRNGSWTICFQ